MLASSCTGLKSAGSSGAPSAFVWVIVGLGIGGAGEGTCLSPEVDASAGEWSPGRGVVTEAVRLEAASAAAWTRVVVSFNFHRPI